MTDRKAGDAEPVADADFPAHARTGPSPAHGRGHAVRPMAVLVAWLGACGGITTVALMVELLPQLQLLVIGSFGASAVLLYGAPKAPFSQPRNLVGGHLVSAAVGVACYLYLPDIVIIQEAVAVATAIALMMLTRTLHPPGGATALIAVIGSDTIHQLGWGYLFPVMIGALLLLVVALIGNNLYERGSYPQRWD